MQYDAPVIIVGAGPVGLSYALQMAKAGTPTIVLERKKGISDHPRAHGINTRTLELFRQWGCDETIYKEALPSISLPNEFLATLGGTSTEERERISPVVFISVAQDIVEHDILRKLETYSEADLRWGWTVESVTNIDDGVEVVAVSPEGEKKTLRSRFCIASDGANSRIRKSLGIEMIGDPCLDRVVNVYFYGQIIGDQDIPTLGEGSKDKDVAAVFIAMDGKLRHTFQYFLSDEEDAETFINDPALCESLIRRAARMPDDREVDIRSIKPWTMTALVAERMREGNIFLVGDAAHAFPPSGGFGLNSGVQDSHNLAWKMQAVLDGYADEALLDSYQAERQPVAFLNTAQSFRNLITMDVNDAPRVFNVSEDVIEDINERAQAAAVRSSAADHEDEAIRGAFELIEHGAALGQDLGYGYTASPVIVQDGRPRPDMIISTYTPNACPGSRAPHFWMTLNGQKMSSLDLFEQRFVALTGPDGESWIEAVNGLGNVVPLAAYRVGEGQDVVPETEDFQELYGVSSDGVVFVRPDGFVAYRSETKVDNPSRALRDAIDVAYGRSHLATAAE